MLSCIGEGSTVRIRILAAPDASELCRWTAPVITEGAGKAGRRLAPAVRVQQKSTRQNHRLSRVHPAFPARWLYGLYVVSPGTGFLAPVTRALVAPQI